MIEFQKGNLRTPRFEQPVYVVAGGMTDFRKRYPEKATEELVAEAVDMTVRENNLKVSMAELKGMVNFCVYSQFADHFGDQLLAAARVHDALGFDPLGNIEVKTGGATGGHAVLAAAMAIASVMPTWCRLWAGSAWTRCRRSRVTPISPRRRVRTSSRSWAGCTPVITR